MRKTAVLVCLICALAAQGPMFAAEIVYLNCDLPSTPQHAQAFHYAVTLDEGSGSVSWVDKDTGVASRAKAIFTRDTVAWKDQDPDLNELFDMSFEISRVNLSFTMDLTPKKGPTRGETQHFAGTCSIDNSPRKF